MPDYVKFPAVLLAVTLVSAASLAFINKVTAPKIEAQKQMDKKQAESLVFPGAEKTVEKQAGDFAYKEVYRDGALAGYIVEGAAVGYSSTIRVLVGVDKAFTVKGVKILSQQETPGLGTKIEQVKSDNTWMLILMGKKSLGLQPGEPVPEPWFPAQYRGLKLDQISLDSGKIDVITSATISSEATTVAVRQAVAGIQKAVAP